jgi:hypothetical protein
VIPEVIAEYILSRYTGKVVEIGIGYYPTVALMLSEKLDVIATDSREVRVPSRVKFFVDDIFDPDLRIYQNASLIYSIRPPPELYKPLVSLAEKVEADCLIRPFANEAPEGGKLLNYKGERFYIFRNIFRSSSNTPP